MKENQPLLHPHPCHLRSYKEMSSKKYTTISNLQKSKKSKHENRKKSDAIKETM